MNLESCWPREWKWSLHQTHSVNFLSFFFHTQEQFCSSHKLIHSSSIYCLNLFTHSDCCCVKWGGIKPHVEWVNVPVCYRPCEYFPAVCTAAFIYSVPCKLWQWRRWEHLRGGYIALLDVFGTFLRLLWTTTTWSSYYDVFWKTY